MSVGELEVKLARMEISDLIKTLRTVQLLKKVQKCEHCDVSMVEKNYNQSKEGVIWRCDNKICVSHRIRLSIRKGSFFDGFSLTLLQVLKVLLRWAFNTPQASVCRMMDIDGRTYKKVINKI